MKNLSLLALVLLVATGCQYNNRRSDVVKETYIHKYGVPVAKTDWDEQGQNGKIVQLKKDGVTFTQSFASGTLDGETTRTFPNSSTVQWVETYADGQLVAVRENYTSGVPMREEAFQNGQLAKRTRWYEDGTPAATESYSGNSLMKAEYRTPLNVAEAHVKYGHGMRICRSATGDLISKDTIENGEMVERITYYPSGDPETITPFAGGKMHGTRLTYLLGGLPNTAEQWVDGKQEGTTMVYLNGEKYAEVPYVAGQKHGIEERFRDGSELVEEVSWYRGKQHGERRLYVDGETRSEWFHLGEVVSRTTYERMNLPQ